ncbi:hypothetical protein [Streptomyces silvisoli]|uniref:Circularly permuted type 2 ATP-grasp protein n=1 Tax=Streptomyces silvisoli TaxID=3034235 RepID=A0ABT5ZDM6_9ACTN|nr:hypothetical protein [Streptomyces silvisoli]MDF3287932.1 hypothetical protein [Streptomyces silvisoli]
MTAWDWLEPRAVAAWTDFAATEEAEPDRARFQHSIHRSNYRHMYPPPCFTTAASDDTATAGLRLCELLASLPRRIFGDDLAAWAEYLGVPQEDADLMCAALRNPRLRRIATSFMRPDLLVTEGGLKLVELNVATSLGGLSTLPPYTDAARASAYHRFLERRGLGLLGPDTAKTWLETFAALVRRRGDRPLHVFEAIANPADIDSGRRFFVRMIRSAGYEISCGLVTDLQTTDDGAYFEGRRVDVVVTMYTWHESRAFVPHEHTRALMDLDTAGKLDFVGSPAAALFDNKANLELLTAPEFASQLRSEEREWVRTHVPSTFRLRAETADRALADRERLICKPASAYGGKGVAFGRAMTDQEWRALIRERLADQRERYVVQERLRPAVVELPGATPPEREVVLGPLVFGGRFAGVMLRQSLPSGLAPINAANGAESAAVLTVRD